MLRQRIITASIMMLAFLGILFFSPWYVFIAFVGMFFTVGAWEWAALSGIQSVGLRLAYTLVTVLIGLCLGVLTKWSYALEVLKPILYIACFWWAIAFLWVQGFPASAVFWRSLPVHIVLGWVTLVPAWLATMYLRVQNHGELLVLMCLLIVAAADVGAYFSGRRFGRHKLAPAVSPGKSWEGVFGGALFALFVGLLFNMVFGQSSIVYVLAVVMPAALISVVGDLFESMIKRNRGVKDSGSILPGHGGVLDRVDGMLAAIPFFAFSVLMSAWQL